MTLVTGADGFVGRHFLAAQEGVPLQEGGTGVDLRDSEAVARAVNAIRPDRVLHLAAQSFVPRSFQDPRETFDINVVGTLNLLIALKKSGFHGRFLYVSSGDVYGRVPEKDLPVSEERRPQPRSPYAASKVGGESLCWQWGQSEGMEVIIARPFNHVGAGQREEFVLSDVAHRLMSAKAPKVSLALGDIDVTRDYCDVSDIVAAYRLLLANGLSGEVYNICSGQERTVRECIVRMAALANIEIEISVDPSRLRASEQRRMVGDCCKIKALGWRPTVLWDETLRRLLDYWKSLS